MVFLLSCLQGESYVIFSAQIDSYFLQKYLYICNVLYEQFVFFRGIWIEIKYQLITRSFLGEISSLLILIFVLCNLTGTLENSFPRQWPSNPNSDPQESPGWALPLPVMVMLPCLLALHQMWEHKMFSPWSVLPLALPTCSYQNFYSCRCIVVSNFVAVSQVICRGFKIRPLGLIPLEAGAQREYFCHTWSAVKPQPTSYPVSRLSGWDKS